MRAALDQLITYHVLKNEAAARGITVTDAEVDERVTAMRGQSSPADFQKQLDARNTTLDQLKIDARIDMVLSKMLEGEASQAIAATEAEAKDFYDKNPDKFEQPESIRASHILLMVNEKADDATRKKTREKIESILKRARAGEDFAKLAKENSQDGSAQQGGDLGFFRRGQMVPAFEQAAFALKPGEISDVVTTPYGFHIIKAAEKRAAQKIPYEQVKPRILEYLSGQKKQQRVEAFIEEAKKKAKIEVLV
jgi:peptidyl-prolyl cis-trans isomerase C